MAPLRYIVFWLRNPELEISNNLTLKNCNSESQNLKFPHPGKSILHIFKV